MLTGQVLSCGSNSFGQLGVPPGPRRCVVPQAIELLREKVVCVAAGLRRALAATGRSEWHCVPVGDWFGIIWTAVMPWAGSSIVFDSKSIKQSYRP